MGDFGGRSGGSGPLGRPAASAGRSRPSAAAGRVVGDRAAGYAGGARAGSARSARAMAANSSRCGYASENDTQTLRAVIRTRAATFSQRTRIVPHWAFAQRVPASPRRRNPCSSA